MFWRTASLRLQRLCWTSAANGWRLDRMRVPLVGIEEHLDRIEAAPQQWLVVGVVLVALLILAQVGTPFV